MTHAKSQQLSRGALVAFVVGSMIGSGVLTLPAAFGRSTGALGALISWGIAGFGSYLGFTAAFGYWIAC